MGSRLWVCDLEQPRSLAGLECAPGRVSFYPDGKLRGCELARGAAFGEVRCAASPATVRIYPGGALRECVLARKERLAGLEILENVRIELHETGALRRAEIEGTAEIDGYSCRGIIRLTHDGHLLQCTLASPITVQGIDLPSLTRVVLYPDGGLRKLRVRRSFEVEGRGYERDEEVCFGPEGEVVDGPCDIAW